MTTNTEDNMKVEFSENQELEETPTLKEPTAPDTEMKKWLVNYVGGKKTPEKDEVTVGLIVETMAEEFPEFLMAVAEENWIRGYHQALQDVTEGEKIHRENSENSENLSEPEPESE
jgi:hypothetical protein